MVEYDSLPHWNIAYERLDDDRELPRSGTDGSVHRARLIGSAHSEERVLKFTSARATSLAESQRLCREVDVLRLIEPHPNVLQLLGAYQSNTLALVMAFAAADSDLASVLARHPGRRLDIEFARSCAHQLCAGLAHVHAHGVLHRDIKPANILVHIGAMPRFVIADFGRARLRPQGPVKRKAATASGVARDAAGQCTPAYAAPEVFCFADDDMCTYGFSSDCWSIGCVVFETLVGEIFCRARDIASMLSVCSQRLGPPPVTLGLSAVVAAGEVSEVPSLEYAMAAVPDSAQDLVTQLVTWEPRARLKASDAVTHAWFAHAPADSRGEHASAGSRAKARAHSPGCSTSADSRGVVTQAD